MKHRTDVPNERVLSLVEQGLSTEEIGVELGITGRAVRYRLKKLGVESKVRDKGHANLADPALQKKAIDSSKKTWAKKKKVVTEICEVCEKEYVIRRPVLKGKSRFCSSECQHAWMNTFRGETHWNYKASVAAEQRQRAWVDYREWKSEVLKKDNHTCQVCGISKSRLQAHHLDSWHANPGKRFDIGNGVSLCKKCHVNFHKAYGARNNTKEQFAEFRDPLEKPRRAGSVQP